MPDNWPKKFPHQNDLLFGPPFIRRPGPPYFINYTTITLRLIRHTTSLFFGVWNLPPPFKIHILYRIQMPDNWPKKFPHQNDLLFGPPFIRRPGPPYFIVTQLSPYDSYVTQLHFFSEFETSPPLKFTFCTEFALFQKRVNCQAFFLVKSQFVSALNRRKSLPPKKNNFTKIIFSQVLYLSLKNVH